MSTLCPEELLTAAKTLVDSYPNDLDNSFVDELCHFGLAVWFSGNALVSINVVTLRRARLVPGWVTVFRRVNYLGV